MAGLAFLARPQIFGILNVTEDSFSDGGQFLAPAAAQAQAVALADAGADVIDIGPASSHPDAQNVSADLEIERLSSIWPQLQHLNRALSVDSFQVETQRWAMAHGAHWLNDVTGFPHAHFYPELADASCRLVVMHAVNAKGIAQRQTTDPDQIMDQIKAFFDQRLAALKAGGISEKRLVIDPGMGFFLGDQPQVSMRVLAQLDDLKRSFGLPLLVSVTRKSFLRALSGRDLSNIAPMSLAAELWSAMMGADYIRTHDVSQLHDALDLFAALQADRKPL